MSTEEKGSLPYLTAEHLAETEAFYEKAPTTSTWAGRQYRQLLARYYSLLIPAHSSVLEVGCGAGELLSLLPNRDVVGVDLSPVQIEAARKNVPHGTFLHQAGEALRVERKFDYVIISETINQAADVQEIFEQIKKVSHGRTRIVLNFFNVLWRPILGLATIFGCRHAVPPANWLSPDDVKNLLGLAGWELVKIQPRILLPVNLPVLDGFFNQLLAPILAPLCLTRFGVARPRPVGATPSYTVSVVVPARNEAGNLEKMIDRIPEMGAGTEIIFIEGHSKDDTWDRILAAAAQQPNRRIKCLQQTGKGKGNAVREGFAVAEGDILMILDADLTVPPEDLPKFYSALASGYAEFANGVRLVYPMEGEAMQFLNLCANYTFGKVFSWLLQQEVKDTLCGTKVLFRTAYLEIVANRAYFGEFDPFGDFDLLFGADKLSLQIRDVPVRYRDRTYGSTNIDRWRHGALLIRMIGVAARKLKFL